MGVILRERRRGKGLGARAERKRSDLIMAKKIPGNIQIAYSNVFRSYEGKLVLTHMLTDMHFFDEILNEEERIMSNYAKKLLVRCGIWKGANVPDLVNAFFKISKKGK